MAKKRRASGRKGKGRRRRVVKLYSHPTKRGRKARKYTANPRRRRARRNARGWFKSPGKYKGYRVMKRRYSANPRRRRSGGRRRYSMNPAATLMGTVKEVFSTESVQTIIAGRAGFGGALALPQAALSGWSMYNGSEIQNKVVRVASSGVATALLATAAAYFTKDRQIVRNVITGGLIATGWRGVSEAVPADKKSSFPIPLLSGMGDAQSDAFRTAIEAEIVKQLQSEGVSGYLTLDQARRAGMAGMGAYVTPSELSAATMHPVGIGVADEFDPKQARERF